MSNANDLLEQGKYDEVISLINTIKQPSVADRVIRGQAHYIQQQWNESLDDFRHVLRESGPSVNFEIYQKIRTAIGKAKYNNEKIRNFWRSCSDRDSMKMEEIMGEIINGTSNNLEARFRIILSSIFKEEALERLWVEAFNMLMSGCRGDPVAGQKPRTPRRKIIVSGMGWSGSGAVYDYLREFSEIHAVAGESSMIEGGGGFQSFLRASKNREDCVRNAVDFFFRGIFGYAPMRSASCLKELRGARKNTLHAKWSATYAQNVHNVVIAMCELIEIAGTSDDILEDKLANLANAIVDNLISFTAPDDKVVLLDNCIHVKNMDLGKYLNRTHLICCIRDPRSNYVALKQEYAGFSQNIDSYINDQRKKRTIIDDLYSNISRHQEKLDGCEIHMLGFEKFVISTFEREKLALRLGIDIQKQRKFTKFKPWESIRNSQIHQEYQDQSEIERIKRDLAEFCVEPTVVGIDLSHPQSGRGSAA